MSITSQAERDALSAAGFLCNSASPEAEYWAQPALSGVEVSLLGDADGWTVGLFEESGEGMWLADGVFPTVAEALKEADICFHALAYSGLDAALAACGNPPRQTEVPARWRR